MTSRQHRVYAYVLPLSGCFLHRLCANACNERGTDRHPSALNCLQARCGARLLPVSNLMLRGLCSIPYRRRHGTTPMSEDISAAGKRVLVVADELMIRMLLQGMLADLGHTLAGEAGRIEDAVALARQ